MKITGVTMSILGVVSGQNVGGKLDHNCVLDGGYTWCEASNNCVRIWETPCADNYSDCEDCLMKQSSGMNIACPNSCDMVAIDPIPPHVIDPVPVNECGDVMCDMYCVNGFVTNDNGCQICECNDVTPPPISGTDCSISQPTCDNYNYVCPKITEVTHCGSDGINGYTTYRLSLIIKPNMNIFNIYAIYGDRNEGESLYLPPAYQDSFASGSNIGGINPYIISMNPNSNYDSWLTIGEINGDLDNRLSSVGIDFNLWTDTSAIEITDGGVFVMNPTDKIVNGNEYVVGQITVSDNSDSIVILNVQGKTIDDTDQNHWKDTNIRFELKHPEINMVNNIPTDCVSWYDGCNSCIVRNGVLGGCTRMMCFREENPRCLSYTSGH